MRSMFLIVLEMQRLTSLQASVMQSLPTLNTRLPQWTRAFTVPLQSRWHGIGEGAGLDYPPFLSPILPPLRGGRFGSWTGAGDTVDPASVVAERLSFFSRGEIV